MKMYYLKTKVSSTISVFLMTLLLILIIPVNNIYAAGSSIDAISVSPSLNTVTAGESATYTVTLDPKFGLKSLSTNLSVTGLPAGCTASFGDNPVIWEWYNFGEKTSTLTISTSSSTPVGSTIFTITESVSGKTCTATLVVQTNLHYVNFKFTGLPSGASFDVNYNLLDASSNTVSSGTVSFISPDPTEYIGVLPGTEISLEYPEALNYGGTWYRAMSASRYLVIAEEPGVFSTFDTANYAPAFYTVKFVTNGVRLYGYPIYVYWSGTDTSNNPTSGVAEFETPGPGGYIKVKPGSLFYYSVVPDEIEEYYDTYHTTIENTSPASPLLTENLPYGVTTVTLNFSSNFGMHYIRFVTTGLPNGTVVNVNWYSKLIPPICNDHNQILQEWVEGTTTFISPGPSEPIENL